MINKTSFPTDKYNQYTDLKEALIKAVSMASKSESNRSLFKAILDVAMEDVGLNASELPKKKPEPKRKSVRKPTKEKAENQEK